MRNSIALVLEQSKKSWDYQGLGRSKQTSRMRFEEFIDLPPNQAMEFSSVLVLGHYTYLKDP